MKHSDSLKEIAQALAKCQQKFELAKRESVNPDFVSRYADLGTIIRTAQPILGTEGLAYTQTLETDLSTRTVTVLTLLMHVSGEWLSGELEVPATQSDDKGDFLDIQTIGAAITYARRYALQSILGIAADLDDDGSSLTDRGTRPSAERLSTVVGKLLSQQKDTKNFVFELDSEKTLVAPENSPEVSRLLDQIGKVISVKARKLSETVYELVTVGTVIAVDPPRAPRKSKAEEILK